MQNKLLIFILFIFLFQHKFFVQRVTSRTRLKVLSIIIVVQHLVSNHYQLINLTEELRLWSLTPLSTIFQLDHCGEFYRWRKPEDPEKTTDLPQVTDKLYYNVVSSTSRHNRVRTHNFGGDRH